MVSWTLKLYFGFEWSHGPLHGELDGLTGVLEVEELNQSLRQVYQIGLCHSQLRLMKLAVHPLSPVAHLHVTLVHRNSIMIYISHICC